MEIHNEFSTQKTMEDYRRERRRDAMGTKTKKVPKVLLAAQKATRGNAATNWGKGTGGPYPWSKK